MKRLSKKIKNKLRLVRHRRVRKVVAGAAERPRLSVFRSLKSMCAQLIDDSAGKTLCAVSGKELVELKKNKADAGERKAKLADSYLLGKRLAQKAKEKNITAVVFDRGGYKYHGRVKALAEGARDGGLQF